MKKIIYAILAILTFVTSSCNDGKILSTNACMPNVSIDDIDWINDLKRTITNCTCEVSIIQGKYESQNVFFIALTDPACNGIDTPTLYDCEGNELRAFTTSTLDQIELRDKVTKERVLYRCKSQ